VQPGEEVRVAKGSRELDSIASSLLLASKGQPVSWVVVDRDLKVGRVTERPTRDTIPIAAEEQLIVELYSK
jgi:small subunit ribosomal protein S4